MLGSPLQSGMTRLSLARMTQMSVDDTWMQGKAFCQMAIVHLLDGKKASVEDNY